MDTKLDWGITKTQVILISGKAGVGKTTTAHLILNNLPNENKIYSVIQPFASGVKIVARTMGWDGHKTDRGRKLLQDIGNAGREYNQNTWIEFMLDLIAEKYIFPLDYIIADDWRFPNESDYFATRSLVYDLFKVRVEAPNREILQGTPYYNDISEISLPPVDTGYYDIVINNEGSIDDLISQVKKVTKDFLPTRTF